MDREAQSPFTAIAGARRRVNVTFAAARAATASRLALKAIARRSRISQGHVT
jgi:hypothetical protein